MAIDFQGLIGNNLKNYTQNILDDQSSEVLTFYIDNSNGLSTLDRYTYENNIYNKINNGIEIYSIEHTEDAIDFIKETYKKIDKLIDIDFIEMKHNNGSLIDIYSVSSSSIMTTNTIGIALQQISKAGSWWDILWKDLDNSKTISNADKNTVIHEIGHSLGLSHPFESPFNSLWNSDDTVMSYNEGRNGWSTWFTDADIKALQKMWGRENDTGTIEIEGLSSEYKFQKTIDNKYSIKTEIGLEDLTDISAIKFNDKKINIKDEIVSVFDEITGIDEYASKVYRLYNAAFGRFPDIEGFNYWINMKKSNQNTYNQTAESFILSDEFNSRYGDDLSNSEYLEKLYINVLGRTSDENGKQYWLNQLILGNETKGQVLIGFSESNENKGLFMQEVGL